MEKIIEKLEIHQETTKQALVDYLKELIKEEISENNVLIKRMDDINSLMVHIHHIRKTTKEFDEEIEMLERETKVIIQESNKKLMDLYYKSFTEWQVEGNFLSKFKVVQIAVPQIRSDYAGKSGVVHLA